LQEIAKANVISVHFTITTLDAYLARQLEPRAPTPQNRLEAVRRLTKAGIPVLVMPSPIMPGLNDSERSLDRVAKAARDAGAESFGGGSLFLMPSAQKVFFPFLEKARPDLAAQYHQWFERSPYLGEAYKKMLAARVRKVRDRYGLVSGPPDRKPPVWIAEQGELFDEPGGV
jgi:DNA repair photolyase